MNTSITTDTELIQNLCHGSLSFFIEQSFSIINPGGPFVPNWHIDLIAEHLQALTDGHIKRLIINVPPRSLKSGSINVCWPAWLFGLDPSRRILSASYSQGLSIKHALDCRHLMSSGFYRRIFPGVSLTKGENSKNKFVTQQRGYRFSTSVGGTITGEGGDYLILDDPHNALHINSKKRRENVITWFQQSFLSRLDNKKTGVVVLIMQRLHPDDLTGYLLDTQMSSWEHLNIPAIAPKNKIYIIGGRQFLFRENELLHNTREGAQEIEVVKRDLGTQAFSAQYLQDPIAISHGMIKESYFTYYDKNAIPSFVSVTQSWDTAIKSGDGNSYSVCTTWGETQSSFYLLDVYRERVEYPSLKRKVLELFNKWNPDQVLIEDKASGQSLLQDLRTENPTMPLVAIICNKDKFTRFARVSVLFENRHVLLPNEASWKMDYEKEVLSFPHTTNDDQVDSTSQYLNHIITKRCTVKPRIRGL